MEKKIADKSLKQTKRKEALDKAMKQNLLRRKNSSIKVHEGSKT